MIFDGNTFCTHGTGSSPFLVVEAKKGSTDATAMVAQQQMAT
jgi:hypothetical protein